MLVFRAICVFWRETCSRRTRALENAPQKQITRRLHDERSISSYGCARDAPRRHSALALSVPRRRERSTNRFAEWGAADRGTAARDGTGRYTTERYSPDRDTGCRDIAVRDTAVRN